MAKKVEFTGSPKAFGYKTKEIFLELISPYGFEHGKMTKRNNTCDILCCEEKTSGSAKLKLAEELGVEILTYGELAEMLFD
jgi:hypothetical protein